MESKSAYGYTDRKVARVDLRHPEARCVFRRDSGSLTFDVTPSGTSRWRAVARVLRSPVDALSCALLPSSCVLCGSPLPQLSSAPICNVCWTEFPIQSGPVCSCCGDTLGIPVLESAMQAHGLCRTCRMAPPPFVRAVAYGLYQGRMKAAIHALKYDGLHPVAKVLGRMLAEAIGQLAQEAPAEMLVVPVPLHRSKHAQRGFNQARSLAVHALNHLRKTHPQWRLTLASSTLMRLRATGSQAGLSSRQRRLNVRAAFSVSDPASVADKDILLIDDIFTTGATARSAAQALKRAGAASVWVATLARARMIHQPSSSLYFSDAENITDQPDNFGAATVQQASIYSSQDQPSF
jgi:ComF family protein